MIVIKRWDNKKVIHQGNFKSVKECLEDGVKKNINFYKADLYEADLNGADLIGADLIGANLYEADLNGADLEGANLYGAILRDVDLEGANLIGTNLINTDLINTCLDPNNKPNAIVPEFKIKDGYCIGYRTEEAGHMDKYRVGRCYSADVFSTANTECHPGLYLWPTLKQAKEFRGDIPMIKVRTKPEAIHKAGDKYRCQWFDVIERI